MIVIFASLLATFFPHDEVESQLGKIFPKIAKEQFVIAPIDSFTNKNYRITNEMSSYVLRLPGIGTYEYIDRRSEYRNATEAFQQGFNPAEVIYFDLETGVQLTSFVDGESLLWNDFYKPPIMEKVVTFLKKIHNSDLCFNNEMDVFTRSDTLFQILEKQKVDVSAYRGAKKQIDTLRPLLYSSYFPKVPCHNDPIPPNFVQKSEGLTLLDWEYSGKNHPAWDFAHLSCIMNYTDEQDRYLIDYYNPKDPHLMYACVVLFKPVAEFWISLWIYSQLELQVSKKEVFLKLSEEYLQQCKRSLDSLLFLECKKQLGLLDSRCNSDG